MYQYCVSGGETRTDAKLRCSWKACVALEVDGYMLQETFESIACIGFVYLQPFALLNLNYGSKIEASVSHDQTIWQDTRSFLFSPHNVLGLCCQLTIVTDHWRFTATRYIIEAVACDSSCLCASARYSDI